LNNVKSEYKFLQALKKKQNLYEDPILFKIDQNIVQKFHRGVSKMAPKSYTLKVMPLRFMFKRIFEIPGLLKYTLKNINCPQKYYYL